MTARPGANVTFTCAEPNTVEPVSNGPVLSRHPLLNGQFSKSRNNYEIERNIDTV